MTLVAHGAVRAAQKTVVITGASGLVGSALCLTMPKHSWQVRAVVRRPVPDLHSVAEVALVRDLADQLPLATFCAGADTVVHLAARVHVMREDDADPLAAFRRVNVEGTRAVYAAAREAGVRRFVFLSSVKAMGEGSPAPYRESDTPHPVDPYGISKLEAERVLAEGRVAGGPEFVVLRPPLVYGAGVRGNFRRLLRLAALSTRVPLPLGGIPNRRSLVSLTNLVSAIALVVQHPAAADRTFLVSDGEDLSTSDMIGHLAEGMGRAAKLLPCPVRPMRRLAAALGKGAEADRVFGSLVVDSSRLRAVLGWVPPENTRVGLHATGDWWRNFQGGARDA